MPMEPPWRIYSVRYLSGLPMGMWLFRKIKNKWLADAWHLIADYTTSLNMVTRWGRGLILDFWLLKIIVSFQTTVLKPWSSLNMWSLKHVRTEYILMERSFDGKPFLLACHSGFASGNTKNCKSTKHCNSMILVILSTRSVRWSRTSHCSHFVSSPTLVRLDLDLSKKCLSLVGWITEPCQCPHILFSLSRLCSS